MSRLRTDFWVAAHLRRCRSEGIEAVLRRRGAAEAGAVFVTVDRLDGTVDLYGPAPQSELLDDFGRLFALVLAAAPAAGIDDRMAREVRFDPDLWWLSIDDRMGRSALQVVPDEPR